MRGNGRLQMKAMVLERVRGDIQLEDIPVPEPAPDEVLIRVHACGVCRTDLHIIDGELPNPKLPLVLGHEIVGTVVKSGELVKRFSCGQKVGVPWLGYTCGKCEYCVAGKENLCEHAKFTGYHIDGGYAEYCVANEQYCFPIPDNFSDVNAAPLLCAGLIGYRALVLAGDSKHIGFYGFGSSAHILIQIARYQNRKVYAFTRPGDTEAQQFARRLGATWAGDSTSLPPQQLDNAIIFAPAGYLLPQALRTVKKGGTVICAGIYMSDIPSFPYNLLWAERVVRSVANLTRRDGEEFLALAGRIPVHTEVEEYSLSQVNEAIEKLRAGKIHGTAVLRIS